MFATLNELDSTAVVIVNESVFPLATSSMLAGGIHVAELTIDWSKLIRILVRIISS